VLASRVDSDVIVVLDKENMVVKQTFASASTATQVPTVALNPL
jgi:hypothetical protein